MQALAKPSNIGLGLKVLDVNGCLHLKSAVTIVDEETLLMNRSSVDANSFEGTECIDVDPGEPYAANALLIGDALVYPQNFPKTRLRLENKGISAIPARTSALRPAIATTIRAPIRSS